MGINSVNVVNWVVGILLSSRVENVLGKEEYILLCVMKVIFISNLEISIIVLIREK